MFCALFTDSFLSSLNVEARSTGPQEQDINLSKGVQLYTPDN